MTRKDQRRLAVVLELGKQFVGARRAFDAAFFRMIDVIIPAVVETHAFGAQASARSFSSSSGDFSGNAAVRLSRAILSARRRGPMKRVMRPNRFAVFIGS